MIDIDGLFLTPTKSGLLSSIIRKFELLHFWLRGSVGGFSTKCDNRSIALSQGHVVTEAVSFLFSFFNY
jgi:hypothetical protein